MIKGRGLGVLLGKKWGILEDVIMALWGGGGGVGDDGIDGGGLNSILAIHTPVHFFKSGVECPWLLGARSSSPLQNFDD